MCSAALQHNREKHRRNLVSWAHHNDVASLKLLFSHFSFWPHFISKSFLGWSCSWRLSRLFAWKPQLVKINRTKFKRGRNHIHKIPSWMCYSWERCFSVIVGSVAKPKTRRAGMACGWWNLPPPPLPSFELDSVGWKLTHIATWGTGMAETFDFTH